MENIKLLASVPAERLREKMLENIEQCESIRIVVAYWTLTPYFFHSHKNDIPLSCWFDYDNNRFVDLIGKKDSFICVDIQNPTNIDELKKYKIINPDANIYLHHYALASQVSKESYRENLLHSKMIVFDYGCKVEVWLGSHNFTKRALLGVNLEASLALTIGKEDMLYRQIDDYMQNIKNNK